MRKPRMLVENGLYHVVARVNRKEFILKSAEIREMFLAVLKRSRCKYRFKLLNFCIMGNHIHFLIKPGKRENLSKIMQWVLSVFAIQFNKRLGLSGHVWYDRFKSKIVDGLYDFLHAFRYIAENPVRAGIVRFPWEYFSNGVTYLRNRDFRLIEKPHEVLKLMEPSLCEAFLLT